MTQTKSRSTGGSSRHDEYERVHFGWDVWPAKGKKQQQQQQQHVGSVFFG
jgi:hypothetical protein